MALVAITVDGWEKPNGDRRDDSEGENEEEKPLGELSAEVEDHKGPEEKGCRQEDPQEDPYQSREHVVVLLVVALVHAEDRVPLTVIPEREPEPRGEVCRSCHVVVVCVFVCVCVFIRARVVQMLASR